MSKSNDHVGTGKNRIEHLRELTAGELEHVSGGNEFTIRPDGVTHNSFSIQKLVDKATPKLF